jgi:hypothetical protein
MRIQRLLFVAILAGLVSAAASIPAGSVAYAKACNDMWMPVCGKLNGMKHTYSNACWAKMAKARIVHKGECKWKWK